MSIVLPLIDGIGMIGFAFAFWLAGQIYTKRRFGGSVATLYYTSMFAGFVWVISLFLSNFFPDFGESSPWLFAFMIGLLTALLLSKAT